MLEKLLLAGAVTFSVYVFSGVQLPTKFGFPLAFGFAETSTQIENEAQLTRTDRDNTLPSDPTSAIANNSLKP
ncbi:MAG: hypothetical protein SXA11_14650 [Cyanobacteriota bacterium]|nr:hypothetical protein [Cyanobacteriota bacterium]